MTKVPQTSQIETPVPNLPGANRAVLVTGAAGTIGRTFVRAAASKYRLRLMVRGDEPADAVDSIRPFGDVFEADLADIPRLRTLCGGIDTVVHLAGNANASATWEQLLPANIAGTYNLFAAARFANCQRIIYASSIHAVSGYPADVQVKVNEPVNPGDLYGVSKCFGEALARYMAEQEGLSAICIRIGAFTALDSIAGGKKLNMFDAIISDRDMVQLIERAIDTPGIRFAIVQGLSDNRFKRLDITDARRLLGYTPQDDSTELNPVLSDLHLRSVVAAHNLKDDQAKSGLRQTERETRG